METSNMLRVAVIAVGIGIVGGCDSRALTEDIDPPAGGCAWSFSGPTPFYGTAPFKDPTWLGFDGACYRSPNPAFDVIVDSKMPNGEHVMLRYYSAGEGAGTPHPRVGDKMPIQEFDELQYWGAVECGAWVDGELTVLSLMPAKLAIRATCKDRPSLNIEGVVAVNPQPITQ